MTLLDISLICLIYYRINHIIILPGDKVKRIIKEILWHYNGRAAHLNPMEHVLDDVHEIVGTGTIFPDKDGNPLLHMHIASGRNKTSVTGCVRSGVKVWHIMEVVLFELVEVKARRLYDPKTGFELLEPSGEIE